MLAIVKKDNQLIQHCRASKYKNGPVVGMRVPLFNFPLLSVVSPKAV